MWKHFLTLFGLSFISVWFSTKVQWALAQLEQLHRYLLEHSSIIFAGGETGLFIRQVLVLFALPIAISLLLAAAYWLYKRKMPDYFLYALWISWVMMLTLVY